MSRRGAVIEGVDCWVPSRGTVNWIVLNNFEINNMTALHDGLELKCSYIHTLQRMGC